MAKLAKLKKKPGVALYRVGPTTVKLRDDDNVALWVRQNGREFEPETLAVWASACEDGKAQTTFDVGSYAGLFAISSALMGNHSIAFEANPYNVVRIEANAAWNRAEITILAEAVSNRMERSAPLYMNGSDTSVIASLKQTKGHNRSILIDTLKLDCVGNIKGKVGAIKIDVEGTEADVIEGALGIIDLDRPVLLVETMDDEERKQRVLDLLPGYSLAGFLDGRNMHMVPR